MIAHILTKLQVGTKLSELIRDPSSQAHETEQGRWQAKLSQTTIELIAILTNCGRASTLAAMDAVVPTLRRIERAAIAAATPIYNISFQGTSTPTYSRHGTGLVLFILVSRFNKNCGKGGLRRAVMKMIVNWL